MSEDKEKRRYSKRKPKIDTPKDSSTPTKDLNEEASPVLQSSVGAKEDTAEKVPLQAEEESEEEVRATPPDDGSTDNQNEGKEEVENSVEKEESENEPPKHTERKSVPILVDTSLETKHPKEASSGKKILSFFSSKDKKRKKIKPNEIPKEKLLIPKDRGKVESLPKKGSVSLFEKAEVSEKTEELSSGNFPDETRISRFSLGKFVSSFRDKRSVNIRQMQIEKMERMLFRGAHANWGAADLLEQSAAREEIRLPSIPFSLRIGLFFFRKFYTKRGKNEKLEESLKKAKMPYSAVQYYSMITMISVLAIFGGILGISLVSMILGMFIWPAYLILIVLVFLGALMALGQPQSVARKRRKDIDSKLPMALAYIATMASADIPVETIMYELGRSKEYGEISKEAMSVSASSRLFGKDIITALREESKYSPSLKFSEFLQGIVSTVTSGGNLKEYFTSKAKQFQSELTTLIKANAESVGVLAESYVTVGVAFPLMLLVILGVMASLSPNSGSLTLVLYLIVLMIIPIITFAFTFLVSSTVKEVQI